MVGMGTEHPPRLVPPTIPMSAQTSDFTGRVRAAGKPSDEPLRKGETESPDPITVVMPLLTLLRNLARAADSEPRQEV
jgi:hypothetical protein